MMSCGKRAVSHEEICAARVTDMWPLLVGRYGHLFIRENNQLRLKEKTSLVIHKGFPGYIDFATKEHGNSVDFFVREMKLDFVNSVTVLNEGGGRAVNLGVPQAHPAEAKPEPSKGAAFPAPADLPYSKVISYLGYCGIPESLVEDLINKGILYQDTPHNNCVFITPQKDCCEIRGTLTTNSFHGCRKIRPNRFWYYTDSSAPKVAYICESAIDAISLSILYHANGPDVPAVFISSIGVANQSVIDRVKSRIPTVLAVDNDAAGQACRNSNLDISFILPQNKDWNEDLMKHIRVRIPNPFPYQTRFL